MLRYQLCFNAPSGSGGPFGKGKQFVVTKFLFPSRNEFGIRCQLIHLSSIYCYQFNKRFVVKFIRSEKSSNYLLVKQSPT